MSLQLNGVEIFGLSHSTEKHIKFLAVFFYVLRIINGAHTEWF